MNKLLYIFLLFSQMMWSQSQFDKGNELYRKGDFKGAVEAYESVLKTKKESAELYYNLGNAFYKLNEVAPAIYNYEKALLLDPNDKDTRNNLTFAQKMQIDEIRDVRKAGVLEFLNSFTSSFHYNTWAWISVAFAIVFLLLFLGYYFTSSAMLKKVYFGSMGFTFLFILIAVSAAVFERNAFENERPAIVFAAITAVKSEPSKDVGDAFVLHEGTKVYVLETLENWRKVELPDGTQGWLESDAIRELK